MTTSFGIQVENEMVSDPAYLLRIKQMIKDCGMNAPLFTATAWGVGKPIPSDELLPIYGGYPEAPWEQHTEKLPPHLHHFFTRERSDPMIGNDVIKAEKANEKVEKPADKTPFMTCEIGGGNQVTYHRRPILTANDVLTIPFTMLGSGCNLLGYYMYHGGKNPIIGGEYYDSRKELTGWAKKDFACSGWKPAVFLETPRGERRICEAEPILCQYELKPVSIHPVADGYLYDFGVNRAGLCRLTISGHMGQEISMEHGELLQEDGSLNLKNIAFVPEGYVQKDIFICNGDEKQEHIPSFTYHGFRYVAVKGIEEGQATPELLTYLVLNSNLKERGGFACSCETLNKLQEMTRASTLANFYYFPTDCPHREKNGWTGDASVSAEHTLLNLEPEKSYREWLRNIRKAQTEDGAFPGIVPTGGWGVDGWAGPAWDNVIVNLPYYTYLYRGQLDIVQENETAIWRYLHFLSTKRDKNGLVGFGLGDWCHPATQTNNRQPWEVGGYLFCILVKRV